jgi:hypothetical protein
VADAHQGERRSLQVSRHVPRLRRRARRDARRGERVLHGQRRHGRHAAQPAHGPGARPVLARSRRSTARPAPAPARAPAGSGWAPSSPWPRTRTRARPRCAAPSCASGCSAST